jgi:LytR cell envelope-related transcriptional attenuator
VAALARVVTVGVSDYVVIDDAHWSRLVAPVAPVEVTIDQPVGEWAAGPVSIPAADVGRFLAAKGANETDIDRLDRQQQFWGAWLDRIGEGGDDAVPGEVDTGLGRFVRGIARGPTTAAALPVVQDDTGGGGAARLVPESPQLESLVTKAVPFPVAPEPGRRIRVRLLNGTSDPSLTTAAAPALVEAGAEITIVGNAPSFDVARTTVAYVGRERVGAAGWLAAKAGIGRIEDVSVGGEAPLPSPDDEIDVTVILGQDARELTRR